ncbi:hypothetical protein KP509_13G079600 [Ceratopteris richardii]|uniref:Prephenate dehydratase domain-containing protein n=1 Tax=Ceratopteris richardii TaxID=49495 RepID=A0A8T2TH87_CERRI|nr:hypothetical protein KP509_13G079600 [Ceratopteris richardii]
MHQVGLSVASAQITSHIGASDGHVQRRHNRPHLENLPIARDVHGRSPLQAEVQSLRPMVRKQATLEMLGKPLQTPVALESQNPIASERLTFSSGGLSVSERHQEGTAEAREPLRICNWNSAELLHPWGGGIVACESSPTARVLQRAFPECHPSKYPKSEAALAALEGLEVHRALLPVESSIHGSVHRTYDLLLNHNGVHIVGEVILNKSTNEQETEFANRSEPEEYARFWVLSRSPCLPPIGPEQDGPAGRSFKTTIAMVLREGIGALHKVFAAFSFRGIAVNKVESRPWRAQPLLSPQQKKNSEAALAARFQYVVFVEFESSTASYAARNVLTNIQEHCSFMRMLGSYPSFSPLFASSCHSAQKQPPLLTMIKQPSLVTNIQT